MMVMVSHAGGVQLGVVLMMVGLGLFGVVLGRFFRRAHWMLVAFDWRCRGDRRRQLALLLFLFLLLVDGVDYCNFFIDYFLIHSFFFFLLARRRHVAAWAARVTALAAWRRDG